MNKIKTALVSVFHKDNLSPVVESLKKHNIKIFSTGGTLEYINKLGIEATSVESLTSYPSILGGRVKTLHPKIFGGILGRRSWKKDQEQLKEYQIPEIDLVIVDLYPFEETVRTTVEETEIIEKIDIGGISLIRAAAKNYTDVLVVPSSEYYDELLEVLNKNGGHASLEDRKRFAAYAFDISSHYDAEIYKYFSKDADNKSFKQSTRNASSLRYGENPHQHGVFYGHLDEVFDQLHGKAISYNNLIDIDAAINLIREFEETTFAILKHNNACGICCNASLTEAWKGALAGDPVSAFGGVLIANQKIDEATAEEINKIFFEVIIAPSFENNALNILKSKKNRIILQLKKADFPDIQYRSILNGTLLQSKDLVKEKAVELKPVTNKKPNAKETEDLLFANIIVKHTKSNAIVLAKNKQLCASGLGQTSRVDALVQAIDKAGKFNFDLKGAVMASDAYFPFADSVELANKAGITAVIQPGGSIRDQESIDYCNNNDMAMVFTGIRHFKH